MTEGKLYYSNPYLKNFTSKVTNCIKKNDFYIVTLKETAFYPEGGGQIYDTGTISNVNVVEVHESNGEILHTVDKEFPVGKIVECEINWENRFSNMQHHTAEHIISGIINKIYGADNVGFHLGESFVTMDYNVVLNADDILKIEQLSNEAVYKNIKVITEYHNTIPEFNYRSKIDIEGTIRIVNIPTYDVCACCGTHADYTGEVGLIKIINFSKYKSGTRIHMISGDKALADYDKKHKILSELSVILSSSADETINYVKNILEERNQLKLYTSNLKLSLQKIEADNIVASDKICLFFDDYSVDDFIKFYKLIKDKSPIIALFSGSDKDGYKYFVYSKNHDAKSLAKPFNEALNGKGGGKEYICGNVNAPKEEIENYIASLYQIKNKSLEKLNI